MKTFNFFSLQEGPAETFTEDDNGEYVMTKTYVVPNNQWFWRRPAIGSAHPEYPAARLASLKSTRQEGQVRLLELTYKFRSTSSHSFSNRAPSATYALSTSTSEAPLLSHKRYKSIVEGSEEDEKNALVQIFNGYVTDEAGGNLKEKVKSSLGKELIEKYEKGITSYRTPSIIWSERMVTTNRPNVSDPGKIDNPPGPAPSFSGRNWLFLGTEATEAADGESWESTSKWELSDEGGWDSDIY